MTTPGTNGWALEVVRGREVGRAYAIGSGRSVLGNALNGEPGIDLASQEGSAPRRMAARQAWIDRSGDVVTLRDLDSPGGTFVNRQRVLPGQSRRLEPDDLLQLGSVQLRVVAPGPPRPTPTPTPTSPPLSATPRYGPLASPFALANGATCRTWDDFLTVSSQSWSALRDELTSGRLGTFLRAAGRDDLIPSAGSSRTHDERLDEWLGRLPTTRALVPDLDVHPGLVRVKALGGGGLTRSMFVVTNTGYRLLRSTLRIEPPEADWVRLAPAFVSSSFTTAETTEIPLDIHVPETLTATLTAAIVIESNGGSRRVEIRLEPSGKPELPTLVEPGFSPGAGSTLEDDLAAWPPARRWIVAGSVGLGLRILIVLGDMLAGAIPIDNGSRPSLAGGALVLAALGGLAAGRLAARRGGSRDWPAGAFAGAFGGVLLASLVVATCRAIEPALGLATARLPLAACTLWSALGALVGFGSLGMVPFRHSEGETR